MSEETKGTVGPRPKIVCLCGSTKFKKEFESVNRDFTINGHIVLSVGVFGHAEGVELAEEMKRRLDGLHLRKIDMSDFVYVINPSNYVGESTRREIAYAESIGKEVKYYCYYGRVW